jgi:hypothetical protein
MMLDVLSDIRVYCLFNIFSGHFPIKMMALENSEPKIRSLDHKFVDRLVERMKAYADEGCAPPIVHLKKRKTDFKSNAVST